MPKKKTVKAPKGAGLLVELRTEELPPKSLKRLSEAFARGIVEGLQEKHFIGTDAKAEWFATPRRLAVRVGGVLAKQSDRIVERKGPSVQAGLDPNGQPTQALLGFVRACGADVSKFERRKDDKGEYFIYPSKQKGEPLANHLAAIVEGSMKRLPVAKLMRWGSGDAQFVRPVHGVILLHGSKVVPGTVLGLKSGNKTLGHRFLGNGTIVIKHAVDYEKTLLVQGKVIAFFADRHAEIEKQIRRIEKREHVWILADVERVVGDRMVGAADPDLLDEVTALVEYPAVHVGGFDAEFLGVPAECLTLSMKQHQKYFPMFDCADGRLVPRFLVVANIASSNPSNIVHGNERVLRARLSDAKFFYDQDRKHKLEERVPRLANVVYHNKLGSQLARVQRIQKLAGGIAQMLNANIPAAARAAYLCKADLLTDMVGEFPELQGVMGRYYARDDGENPEVADAIEQHYRPRSAGGELPEGQVAVCIALADKLDLLAGMFGIGQQPTGDKDPFGLRRAALGVIRIVIEKDLPLKLNELIDLAFSVFPRGHGQAHTDVANFVFDRLSGYLRDSGGTAQEVEAVLSRRLVNLAEVPKILKAVQAFQTLPEAAALAAANKRIVNILRKAGRELINADVAKLVEPAERALFEALQKAQPVVESCFKAHDYTGALQVLAQLKKPVDTFFDQVMVMADDEHLRANRLALLGDLKALMNRVADISKLAV